MTINAKKGVVRAEVEDATLYAAIDKAADVITRQLRKMKERDVKGGVHTHHKSPATINDLLPEQPAELDTAREAGLPADIIRKKIFHVDSISVEEAVERMEDVGHAFYMFRDLTSNEIQLVYKRNAGGYGVLVPRK